MSVKKRGLGKGLGALLAENAIEEESKKTVWLRISEISPTATSRAGILSRSRSRSSPSLFHSTDTPAAAGKAAAGREIPADCGERRWRAAQMRSQRGSGDNPGNRRTEGLGARAGRNLQREDLNPMEEAAGYKTLMENYGLTQEEIAKVVNNPARRSRTRCGCSTCRSRLPKWSRPARYRRSCEGAARPPHRGGAG